MKTKRITALLLVLVLLICVLPSPVRAAALIDYGKIGEDFSWVLDEYGTLVISGSGYFSTTWHSGSSDNPWADYQDMIKKLVISDGITGMDTMFLSDLTDLQDISIPATLTGLSASTFANCASLVRLTVDFNNPEYSTMNNVLFSKDMSTLIFYPHGLESTYTVPSGVKTIGPGAFSNNRKLTGVTLSSGITTIGSRAFQNCSALSSVTLPNSLLTIESSAFERSGLGTVTIPAKTEVIGSYAFSLCSSLNSIKVNSASPYFSSDNIALFNKDKTTLLQYPGGRSGSYTMPDTVQSFTRHAFWFNEKLLGLELSDALVSIPDDAFAGCKGLSSLTIPMGVQQIGRDIFSADSAPDTVYFLGSAPAIPNGAPFGKSDTNPITMTVYRPENDNTWTWAVEKSYGGKIEWKLRENYSPFADVPSYSWYLDPILWAVENGITNGLTATEFGPNASCNRAQVVTFLYRAAGEPTNFFLINPFVDVEPRSFYEKAVRWAVYHGITTGTDSTHFSPNAVCNRAQVVTFLYRAAGSPEVDRTNNPFTDVPDDTWYTDAVLWAVEYGITNGLSATEFGPNANCNRAQIVTFLYRVCTYGSE